MDIKKFSPVMDAQFAIADCKAVLMHSLNSGTDENCVYDSVTGRAVNTAEFAFRTFCDQYIVHWLEEQNYAPWQILIAHEGGHDYRTKISPDYKANRKPKDGEEPKKGPEMAEQYEKLLGYVKPFLAFLGCTQLHVAGVEGDDVVGYLVEKLSPNFPCAVYTVDADLLRLVDENTAVWIKKNLVFNSYENFGECEGCTPKNTHSYLQGLCDVEGNFLPDIANNVFKFLTLYKSIMGDSSDGYNGVKGLGPAKWPQMVSDYDIDGLDELEAIIDGRHWEDLKEAAEADPSDKIINKLYDARNEWRQGWLLAKIHPQLCWKPTKSKLTKINWYKRVPNADKIKQILTACSCMDLYEDHIEALMPQKWLIDADNLEGDEIADFTELCKETFVVGWDYETWSEELPKDPVNVVGSKPTGASFCLGNNFQYAFYLTTDHKNSANLPPETIGQFIAAIPERTATVAHNLAFETVVTANDSGQVIEGGYDTQIMCSYVDENQEQGLKKCSKRELNYEQETYAQVLEQAGHNEVTGTYKNVETGEIEDRIEWVPAKDMREVTADQVMSYGIDDSIVVCHLFVLYWLRMQLEGSWDFYAENDPYFTKRTALSQLEGANIDFGRLEEIKKADLASIKSDTTRLREILTEHCTGSVNEKAVEAFISADVDFVKNSTKLALSTLSDPELAAKCVSGVKHLTKLMELDDTAEKLLAVFNTNVVDGKPVATFSTADVKAALVNLEVYKTTEKAKAGSVYVPYKCEITDPEVAPTVGNLAKVCTALGLPEITSVAASKLSEWEQELCGIDFESDVDETENLTPDQQEFLNLMRDAKRFFKPELRAGSKEFQLFNSFCCKHLGKKAKEEWTGSELSTGSSKQMQHLFYCMLGLPVRNRSKVDKMSKRSQLGCLGSPGTDSLVVDTALAEDIDGNPELEWKGEALTCVKNIKECETRVSLYLNAYPQFVNPETGRVHPSIRNCGTVTRRPTGSKPNILQVSKHQNEAIMRSVYLPIKPDHIIIAIDFAGQELRMLASVTRDLNLLSAYLGETLAKKYLQSVEDGVLWEVETVDIADLADVKDLHSNTGSGIIQIFGLNEDDKLVAGGSPKVKCAAMSYEEFISILNDQGHPLHKLASKVRKSPAKTSNFLMAYGGSSISLSQKLIIKESQGDQIVNAMMALYPGIEREQAATLKFAKENGYSETAYGNRRHAVSELFSSKGGEVSRQGRQLFNSRIQGTAADVLKVVMRKAETTDGGAIWDRLDAVMMAPVYDEIVASVPAKHAWQYISEMVPIMNLLPPGQAVPMMADVSIGPCWQKQYEVGSFPTQELVEVVAAQSFDEVVVRRGWYDCDLSEGIENLPEEFSACMARVEKRKLEG